MNRLKLFIENFLIYGMSSIISKFIPLIMVPIITRLMPDTEYYGLSDLANTVINFGCALAVIGMYDAMYRMFFERTENSYKRIICSTTICFTASTSIIVAIIMILLRSKIAVYFFGGDRYEYLVYICAMTVLVSATNQIISAPTRMENKRLIYVVANTISPIIAYSITIPLILSGYYAIALPLGTLISGVCMEVFFGYINRKWFSTTLFDYDLLKQMLVIAIPLFPNFLIYWIFNSSDKLMITNMLGMGAAGVYSVSSKLGMCSQLIYTAFTGGWQYFAFSTMNEEDQVECNSKIFEYLGIISYIATGFVCTFSYLIFKVLFKQEYWAGYLSAPYLFLAPLLQMLFQVACNQFIVIKKTWPNMFILLFGAIINIVFNIFLIPVLGIEGASLATLSGYIVADIICVLVLKKMGLFILTKRFVVSSIVMMTFFVFWRLFFSNIWMISLMLTIFTCAVYGGLYREEGNRIFSKFKRR